jgi:integrase
MNLTTQNLSKLTSEGKAQRFIFDTHKDAPKGFGVRVTKAGGKAYVLQYSANGIQKRMTICSAQNMGLAEARKSGRELTTEIDKGIDPLRQKSLKRGEPLLYELINSYMVTQAGKKSEKAIRRYLERDLVPVLGGLKIKSVRRRDIIDLIEDKAARTPTAARCLLAYLKCFFDWCLDHEYLEVSPAESVRPKNIRNRSIKAKRRGRTTGDDEIRSLWVSDLPLLTRLALKLILVTGQRPGEVAEIHTDEIKGNIWTIPASRRLKTNTENQVYLTKLAQEIIAEAREEVARLSKRREHNPTGYIFETGQGLAVSVGDLSKAVKRHDVGNLNHKDWGHWTPHDLRRTCRTGLSACQVEESIAERVIGHSRASIVETYDKESHLKAKTLALEAWERRLRAILDYTLTDNIVSFRSAS